MRGAQCLRARHRARRRLAHGTESAPSSSFFFPSPLISAITVLSSSPSSPVSPPSVTIDATTTASASPFASLHSSFHRPRHRSPFSSAAIAVLFSSHLLASMAILPVSSITVAFPLLPFPPPPSPPSVLPFRSPRSNAIIAPPVFSSSHHRSSCLLFLSTSDCYLDHRRRLPSLFLPSGSSTVCKQPRPPFSLPVLIDLPVTTLASPPRPPLPPPPSPNTATSRRCQRRRRRHFPLPAPR